MTHGNRITREEHGLASRQDLRPTMGGFTFVSGFGDRLGRPSRRRYARKAANECPWGNDDRPVFAPTGAAPVGGVAERDRRAALNGNLFHLFIGEEPDPLPIGREEG